MNWQDHRDPALPDLTGNEDGLVCYFDFDEGEGQIIHSPVGGNGYLGNNESVESADPTWVKSTAPIK